MLQMLQSNFTQHSRADLLSTSPNIKNDENHKRKQEKKHYE